MAMEVILMIVWGVAAAGLAWYAASVAREVTYVTLADGRRQERSLPLTFKLLLPFVGNLNKLVYASYGFFAPCLYYFRRQFACTVQFSVEFEYPCQLLLGGIVQQVGCRFAAAFVHAHVQVGIETK